MIKNFAFLIITASLWQACGSNTDKVAAENPNEIIPDTPVVVREIVGIARIEPPEKIIIINSESEGYVREVRFRENQRVQVGEVLLLLNSEVEQAQLQQARSKVQTQQNAVVAAKATLESLQIKLANARSIYERNLRLIEGNATTQQQLDDSRVNAEDLEKQIEAQQASIAQAQSRLKEIEADIHYYQTLAARRIIRAPLSGVFLSSNVKPGNYITNTTVLGEFAIEGPYQAITEVDELFATKVQVGQSAYLRPQGSSEQLATGKVVYVAPLLSKKSLFSDSPDNLEDRRVREARVQLDANDKVLIGSRVECVIIVGGK